MLSVACNVTLYVLGYKEFVETEIYFPYSVIPGGAFNV